MEIQLNHLSDGEIRALIHNVVSRRYGIDARTFIEAVRCGEADVFEGSDDVRAWVRLLDNRLVEVGA